MRSPLEPPYAERYKQMKKIHSPNIITRFKIKINNVLKKIHWMKKVTSYLMLLHSLLLLLVLSGGQDHLFLGRRPDTGDAEPRTGQHVVHPDNCCISLTTLKYSLLTKYVTCKKKYSYVLYLTSKAVSKDHTNILTTVVFL